MIDGLSIDGTPPGILRVVSAARPGRQDTGHAPGGPQDRAAAWAARAGLGLAADAPVLEIVAAPPLRFTRDARFVLTGAPRPDATLAERPAAHAAVLRAAAGDRLRLGGTAAGGGGGGGGGGGLRTYLALHPGARGPLPVLPPLSARRPPSRPGHLVLIPGPEWSWVDDPALLLGRPWRVTRHLSDAGLRLAPVGSLPAPRCHPPEIVSAPLADGTVQLTPAGPVVFLRERPTLGGYPRIGCLTEASVDVAAQVGVGACVRFRWSEEER